MIRFLNLKNQIEEGENSFAFYDTIAGVVFEFDGEQVFDTLDEFKEAYSKSDWNKKNTARPLSRFMALIPKNYFA
jgi:hypothetical protein